MNDNRPSDTINYHLSAMRNMREAIVVALKTGEYDGEKVTLKELKKLPQVEYRISRAIEIGELLDKVVGNVPYREYGVLATSYELLCLNLRQRINEIDQDKKPSEYLSPERLIPPKDIDIKSVGKCKNTLEKWLANKNLKSYVEPYKEDIDRLNKLVDYCDNQFKNQKNYPGDKLVFSPFPDSVLYYANQLFSDCLNRILVVTEVTPEIETIAKCVVAEDKFSTAYIQHKFRRGQGFISSLASHWEKVGIIGGLNENRPRDLLIKSYDEIITAIQNYNNDIRNIIKQDAKPAGKIMVKTCGMNDSLSAFKRTYRLLIELLNGAIYDDKELTERQVNRLTEIEPYYRQILEVSKSFIVSFDYLNYYQKNSAKQRYARTWLKYGLTHTYDELARIFYQTLDKKHFEKWESRDKPKAPGIALDNIASARKDIADWLNDKKAMKYLKDFEYDMEQALNLKEIEQNLIKGQNEEYLKIVKPLRDSFDEFTNITHYNCQEILQKNNFWNKNGEKTAKYGKNR